MAGGSEGVSEACDAVCLASQLGRLDFVSALLAVLGILLAIGGVIAFINFRGVAKKQAKEEAERVAQEVAEITANNYIQKELPKLVSEYMEIFQNAAEEEQANEIARVQDDGS